MNLTHVHVPAVVKDTAHHFAGDRTLCLLFDLASSLCRARTFILSERCQPLFRRSSRSCRAHVMHLPITIGTRFDIQHLH